MLLSLLAASCTTTGNPAPTAPGGSGDGWLRLQKDRFTLCYKALDQSAADELGAMAMAGRRQVESFFGVPFPSPFEVHVYPDRRSLTERWRRDWSMPELQPECWMAAAGSAEGMTILSPRVWATQACEHDASNAARTQALVTHELTHVFHAQHLPTRSFDGMEDIEWFAEGLATYVSGQLGLGYLAPASEAVSAGKAPVSLRSAHSGKYRYGVCGSMAGHIDARVGRARLLAMLKSRTTKELLAAMGMTEHQFLASWMEAVRGGSPGSASEQTP